MSITLNDAFNEEYDDIVQEGSTKQVNGEENYGTDGGVNDDSTDSDVDESQENENGLVVRNKSGLMKSRSANENNNIPIGNVLLRNKHQQIIAIPLYFENQSSVVPDFFSYVDFFVNNIEIKDKSYQGAFKTEITIKCFASYSDIGKKYDSDNDKFKYKIVFDCLYTDAFGDLHDGSFLLPEENESGKIMEDISKDGTIITTFNRTINDIYDVMPKNISILTYHVVPTSLYDIRIKYAQPFISIYFKHPIITDEGNGIFSLDGSCVFFVSDDREAISDKNGELLDYTIMAKFHFTVNFLNTNPSYQEITIDSESKLMIPKTTGTYNYCKNCNEDAMFKGEEFTFYTKNVVDGVTLTKVEIIYQMFNGENIDKYNFFIDIAAYN